MHDDDNQQGSFLFEEIKTNHHAIIPPSPLQFGSQQHRRQLAVAVAAAIPPVPSFHDESIQRRASSRSVPITTATICIAALAILCVQAAQRAAIPHACFFSNDFQ